MQALNTHIEPECTEIGAFNDRFASKATETNIAILVIQKNGSVF